MIAKTVIITKICNERPYSDPASLAVIRVSAGPDSAPQAGNANSTSETPIQGRALPLQPVCECVLFCLLNRKENTCTFPDCWVTSNFEARYFFVIYQYVTEKGIVAWGWLTIIWHWRSGALKLIASNEQTKREHVQVHSPTSRNHLPIFCGGNLVSI